MAKIEHGSMNVEDHEKTFNGFVNAVKWGAIVCISILILLAIFNG